MRAMAEAAKIMHSDREFVYKVLGKYLRVTEKSILDAAYNAEIKALEPRLAIKTSAAGNARGDRGHRPAREKGHGKS